MANAPPPPPPPPPPALDGVFLATALPPPPARATAPPAQLPPPPRLEDDLTPPPNLWVADAPLHPPSSGWSTYEQPPLDVTPTGPAIAAGRPPRPPIYDPAHYGYGPWNRAPDEPEPVALPPLESPDAHRSRRRAVALSALVGALLAVAAVLGGLAVFGDEPTTVETVFQFPEAGPAAGFEGDLLDIQAVLAKVRPSVVTISTGAESVRGIFEGAGSGVVIGEDGLVLTNAHVIQGADTIEIRFFDGTTKEADLVGSFPDDDIAIVRARNISGLIPAELGSSETLRVGDEVVAIGNALDLGETPSVTKGIVSAKGRVIEDGLLRLENLIQTDAAINPGNSGGPLVNAAGQVVGINTAIIDNAQSIGFAISIDAVKPLIDRALSGDAALNPDIAFLGVTTISVSGLGDAVRDQFGVTATDGAFVQEALAGSPAEGVGVLRGDVIVSIDSQAITSSEDVARTVRALRPGDEVEVILEREGVTEILTVVLDKRN